MEPENQKTATKGELIGGWVLGGLPAAFMLLDGVMKLVKPEFVVQETVRIGYEESVIVGLGIAVLICTVLYLVPKTSALGAILLTGYLGGAVATHVRLWEGWFPVLFPVVFAALLWAGLVLRDPRLRVVLPTSRG